MQARVVVDQLLACDLHLSTGEFVVLERELTADDVINEMNIDHAPGAVDRTDEKGMHWPAYALDGIAENTMHSVRLASLFIAVSMAAQSRLRRQQRGTLALRGTH
jgi:hypothetical protein